MGAETVFRVFTGIQVPADITRLFPLRANNDPFAGRARWIKLKTAHLTLHFFGNFPASRLDRFRELTREVAADTRAFELTLAGPGFFPDESYPKVFWWGVHVPEALKEFVARLADTYRAEGFELEKRPFRPHITLARFREGTALGHNVIGELEYWGPKAGQFSVAHLSLFRSPATPDGYPLIDEFPLKK